jgi:hypothetical protein
MCLKARAATWAERARVECARAKRTWFVTLTLRPEEQYRALAQARVEGIGFDDLPEEEQFLRRHRVISRWLTLFIKRVRKASGAKLRYVLVAERHKSGLPHYHLLLHEVEGAVKHAVLRAQWRLGFMTAKLVPEGDASPARYVSKYLAKAAEARVRASVRYGRDEDAYSSEFQSISDHRVASPPFMGGPGGVRERTFVNLLNQATREFYDHPPALLFSAGGGLNKEASG